jgi:glycosyltransferase involved in cell wall biosynthesis
MPAVSIAIRAFRRRWLCDAIASVLAQTHRDLELVIYDDAGDLEMLATATGDPRIRYHRAAAPRTASGRFAAALALCRGDYVGLLDDDDAYAPDFVARLAAALDADPQAGAAFCRTTWEVDGGTRVQPADPRPAGRQPAVAAAMLRDGWTISPSHLLLRRVACDAALRDQPMPSGVAPDAFLNLRLAMAGWHHVLVDAPLVVTRWHDGQLSRTRPLAGDAAVATWRGLRIDDPVLAALRDRRLARTLIVHAVDALCAGDVRVARDDLAGAAEAAPGAWRASRLAVGGAAACGPVGVWAARLWARTSPRARRRRQPPLAIGDR